MPDDSKEPTQSNPLFDERFLDDYAGIITNDPHVAVSELIANAWDAYATEVDIVWPDTNIEFQIRDNGEGIDPDQFETRWKTLSYNRVKSQGKFVQHPDDPSNWPSRIPFGRHGKGRFAGFCFANVYEVTTWKNDKLGVFQIVKGRPFDIQKIRSNEAEGHGLSIRAEVQEPIRITANSLREYLSSRFSFDPNFTVRINGEKIKFSDIPENHKVDQTIMLSDGNQVRVLVIDTVSPDRTTKQHGLVWWVNSRAVGQPSWIWGGSKQLLDGRTATAKRYTVIIQADCLASCVKPDWSGFNTHDDYWKTFDDEVYEKVKAIIDGLNQRNLQEKRQAAIAASKSSLEDLTTMEKSVWMETLEKISEECPGFSENELSQIMNVLATMEMAASRYSLLGRLENLDADEIDQLDEILSKWNVRFASTILNEVEVRLRLTSDIRRKSQNNSTDELTELQPLIGNSLWAFGPEFESIEYTSNKGMTKVIREIFGVSESGSRNRPDFVMRPQSTVGFYSTPAFDGDFQEVGIRRLVIVELKRPGLSVGDDEKAQVKKYVQELKEKGIISDHEKVTAYILATQFAPHQNGKEVYFDGQMTVVPLLYDTFVNDAERRMMNLRKKLVDGPLSEAVSKGKEVDEQLKQILL